MFPLRIFVILVMFTTLTQSAWFRKIRRRSRCVSQNSCVSCTSTKSWSTASCRWCPEDGKCHAHMAFLANPCSRSKNIVNNAKCSSIIQATYDRNIAYKMVFLSALAFADSVANYIKNAVEVDTFILQKQVRTPCQGNAQCSGFVAVSHSEKIIAVAFKGSQHSSQVMYQAFSVLSTPKVSFQAGGKVQDYFNTVFQLIWKDLKPEVYQQITNYPSYKIWVTGFSLGGALASMASTVIAYEKPSTINRLILYTFGQPRTGDYKYALTHDRLVPISFRITHYRDVVVHLPFCRKLANVCLAGAGPYHHGTEVYYGQRSMTKYSTYRICKGLPHNEDLNCSNRITTWLPCLSKKYKQCINDHLFYFGVNVGNWWLNM